MAKIGFIGYGGVFGPVIELLDRMQTNGQAAKFLEMQTLWPFPGEEVRRFVDSCDVVYVPEYSAGAQLRGLIQREATGPMTKLRLNPLVTRFCRIITFVIGGSPLGCENCRNSVTESQVVKQNHLNQTLRFFLFIISYTDLPVGL